MGNAAAQQDSPLATLVREQVASASRQVEYHLARARAAAAAAQQGHGLRTALAGPLHSLVHTMDKLHAARSIRFELQGDATQWDFKGDSQDLMEMLGNLLDNAGKWARSKVVLKVQPAADDSQRLTLCIDDDGPGIAPSCASASLPAASGLTNSVPAPAWAWTSCAIWFRPMAAASRLCRRRWAGCACSCCPAHQD
jgi:K+-sensing histidine kinase KdpD